MNFVNLEKEHFKGDQGCRCFVFFFKAEVFTKSKQKFSPSSETGNSSKKAITNLQRNF